MPLGAIFGIVAVLLAATYYGFNSQTVNQQAGVTSVINPLAGYTSGKLTAAQIAYIAGQAGFEGDDLTTAIAIAFAESSGNPNAYNPESAAGNPVGQGSYGLWQINLAAHPEYASTNLYDPQTNANAAYAVYSNAGYSFRPWATFTGGQYAQYIAAAQQGENA